MHVYNRPDGEKRLSAPRWLVSSGSDQRRGLVQCLLYSGPCGAGGFPCSGATVALACLLTSVMSGWEGGLPWINPPFILYEPRAELPAEQQANQPCIVFVPASHSG